MLVWDATCRDTFEPLYLARSTSGSSLVAASAEDKKISKYEYLDHSYMFCPVYSFIKESLVAIVNCHAEGQCYFIHT